MKKNSTQMYKFKLYIFLTTIVVSLFLSGCSTPPSQFITEDEIQTLYPSYNSVEFEMDSSYLDQWNKLDIPKIIEHHQVLYDGFYKGTKFNIIIFTMANQNDAIEFASKIKINPDSVFQNKLLSASFDIPDNLVIGYVENNIQSKFQYDNYVCLMVFEYPDESRAVAVELIAMDINSLEFQKLKSLEN